MNKLILKIRFFIKVTLLHLPFLSKKERLDIYKRALNKIQNLIDQNGPFGSGLCWIILIIYNNNFHSKYGFFIECYEMELHFPEIYKLSADVRKERAGRIYWYSLNKDGYIQRKELLEKAIKQLEK